MTDLERFDALASPVTKPAAKLSDLEQFDADAKTAGAPSLLRAPPSESKSDDELGLDNGLASGRDGIVGPSKEDLSFLRTRSPAERSRDEDPVANDWGAQAIIGGLLGGAAGRLVAPAAEYLGAAAPVATGAVEGAVSSKAQGGGALGGGVVGAGLGALGPLGRAVMSSKGGAARQFIEDRGGSVGPTTPGKGGPFDSMVTQGNTDADIGQQAAASADQGLDMLKAERESKLRPIGRQMEAIDNSAAGRAKVDVTDLVTKLEDARDSLKTTPDMRAKLTDQLALITKNQKPGFNPQVHNFELSESDVNAVKRMLATAGKVGKSTDATLIPAQQAASTARDLVDQGPYAQPNAQYAAESNRMRESRRLLGINERPMTPEETRASVDKVKNRIVRRGQNTVTAGGQDADLEEFEQRHPDIGLELSKPALLRKKADLSFSLFPKAHGGLIDRTGSGVATAAAMDAVASLMGHGYSSPAKALTTAGLALALKNMPAIQGRLLYPAAKGLADGSASKLIPLFAAARAAQERP